ncbi:MAG TPA: metallophosphoesterase [Thermoleophilaceae bacterium]|nr:metallophosphoesterase [Thermoleophilaceae bacterium]
MRVAPRLLGAAGAAAAYRALWWEPRHVRLTRRAVALRRWPEHLDSLRVAVIADLHTGAPHVSLAKVSRVVQRVNAEGPDLVALLGDYVDTRVAGATPVAPVAVAAALGGLRAPLGVAAVLGNHDWAEGGREIASALSGAGIAVLENGAVSAGRGLWVAGVADAGVRDPDLDAALAAPPADAPVVLLSHNPDIFKRVPERVSLTLSGHTHGAQVDLPVVRHRLTPSRFGARYAGGVFEERDRVLFVSRGIGTSRLPVRFLAPPEVALLELRSRGGGRR